MKFLRQSKERARAAAREALVRVPRERKTFVDPTAIARSLGINVDERTLQDSNLSGFLRRTTEDGYEIVINEKHSEERRRFTCAHEIGHYMMHTGETGVDFHVDDMNSVQGVYFRNAISATGTKIKEIEANQFAAELLMPTSEVEEELANALQDSRDPEDIILKMARTYKVSVPAMAIKVDSLLP